MNIDAALKMKEEKGCSRFRRIKYARSRHLFGLCERGDIFLCVVLTVSRFRFCQASVCPSSL